MSGTDYADVAPGVRIGRLVVLHFVGKRHGRRRWRVRCDCGTGAEAREDNLRSGNTKSCGCAFREGGARANLKHGRTDTTAYWRWRAMIQRCTNPNNSRWANYGGRGISVCERWRTFANFLADMGDPPSGMTLDRIDVDGDYTPENCRWATAQGQARNRRGTPLLTHNGETRPLIEWAEIVGINFRTVHSRLRHGWSVADALSKPTGVRHG